MLIFVVSVFLINRPNRMITAVNQGRADKVQKLLQKDYDVNFKDKNGYSILHILAKRTMLTSDKPYMLIPHPSNMHDIALILIKNGADVNSFHHIWGTPLHLAAFSYNNTVAKLLIDNGANINILNSYGDAPIHWAVRHGNYELTRYLLIHGADVNIKDSSGWTPLKNAQTIKAKKDLIELLLGYHAE